MTYAAAIATAPAKPVYVWSPQQSAFIAWAVEGKGSCVLEAVAGAGKTTTLLEAAVRMPGSVAIVAFNKKIADEIKAKLEAMGVDFRKAQAGTVHSFGYKALAKQFGKLRVSGRKVRDILDGLYAEGTPEQHYADSICKLVSMAKQRAVGLIDDAADTQVWIDMIEKYDLVSTEGDDESAPLDVIITASRDLLARSNNVTKVIDFDDMVYLPLIHKVRFWQYDVVMMDEAQDTNPARRLMVRAMLRKGGRAIFVGDSRQAIYMFTGADSDALDLCARDFNCIRMPLTVTYRCPQAVVAHAHQWVSHIVAHETAPQGKVSTLPLEEVLADTSGLDRNAAILSRTTKPLVELFFKLLRRRVPAKIEGRDIALTLKKLATRWSRIKTIPTLEAKLVEYLEAETEKLTAKGKDKTLEAVTDRVEAVLTICEQCRAEGKERVEDVVAYLDAMFSDETRGLLVLSTIHKSKGREWNRVYWLNRAGTCPSKYAKTDEALLQESNLCYVATTRAISELIEVTVPPKKLH